MNSYKCQLNYPYQSGISEVTKSDSKSTQGFLVDTALKTF